MKERILDEMYIAYARPIIGIDSLGYYKYGNEYEGFIINPIVRKSVFGKEKIVGGVETISKTRLFNCNYIHMAEEDPWMFYDIEQKEVGGIDWKANFYESADKVLKNEELEHYLNQTPEEMIERISLVKENFKEKAKTKSLCKTLKK